MDTSARIVFTLRDMQLTFWGNSQSIKWNALPYLSHRNSVLGSWGNKDPNGQD